MAQATKAGRGAAPEARRPGSASALAAATPDSRDRYVDFLRALSISVVVLGHWLMAIVTFQAGRFAGSNALDSVPGVWLLTWVLQVMPIFFFVGGFSNLVALRAARRRGASDAEFLAGRLLRLLRPTVVFVAAWTVAALALRMALGENEGLDQGVAVLAKPLWFLAVYVLVVALAPRMTALHDRFGARLAVALAAAAVVVDVLRLAAGVPYIGYLNFAFVWLFAHQLGALYADGTLVRWSRRAHALLATGGLAALAALVTSGVYSPSMVGAEGLRGASNNDPPSVCLVALTCWLVGLAMLARERVSRWLATPRAWTAVVAANAMIMTVFLWHLTALVVAAVVLLPLGFPQPDAGTSAWWLLRAPWIAALLVALAPFVLAFGRFERPGPAASAAPLRPRGPLGLGVALLVLGFAGFAQGGFANPTALVTGWVAFIPVSPGLSAASFAAGVWVLGLERRLLTRG